MAKVINCECGFVVRGDNDDELVANAQFHAKDAHHMEITREQALAVAESRSRFSGDRMFAPCSAWVR